MYLKLHHLVDDKIHARLTDLPLVTQCLWAAKRSLEDSVSRNGRHWRLTAPHTLQEILTVKSDDIVGRVKHMSMSGTIARPGTGIVQGIDKEL